MINFILLHFSTLASIVALGIGIGLIIAGIKHKEPAIKLEPAKENIPLTQKDESEPYTEIIPDKIPDTSEVTPPSSSFSMDELRGGKSTLPLTNIDKKSETSEHKNPEKSDKNGYDIDENGIEEEQHEPDSETETMEASENEHLEMEPFEHDLNDTAETSERENFEEPDLDDFDYDEIDDEEDEEDEEDDLSDIETQEENESEEKPESTSEFDEPESKDHEPESEAPEHDEFEMEEPEEIEAFEKENDFDENEYRTEKHENLHEHEAMFDEHEPLETSSTETKLKNHATENLAENYSLFQHAVTLYRAPITPQNAQENRACLERILNVTKNLGTVTATHDEGDHLVVDLKNGSRLFIHSHEIAANEVNVSTRAIGAILQREMHGSVQPLSENKIKPEEQP